MQPVSFADSERSQLLEQTVQSGYGRMYYTTPLVSKTSILTSYLTLQILLQPLSWNLWSPEAELATQKAPA